MPWDETAEAELVSRNVTVEVMRNVTRQVGGDSVLDLMGMDGTVWFDATMLAVLYVIFRLLGLSFLYCRTIGSRQRQASSGRPPASARARIPSRPPAPQTRQGVRRHPGQALALEDRLAAVVELVAELLERDRREEQHGRRVLLLRGLLLGFGRGGRRRRRVQASPPQRLRPNL